MSELIQLAVPRFHKYAEALRTTKHNQIKGSTTDNKNGRCAIGVLLEVHGWDGKRDWKDFNRPWAKTRYDAYYEISNELSNALSLSVFNNIMTLNDQEDKSFSQIADYLDTL